MNEPEAITVLIIGIALLAVGIAGYICERRQKRKQNKIDAWRKYRS